MLLLNDYESGITCPTILRDLGKPVSAAKIEFRYCLSNPVGFKYSFPK